LRQQAPLPVNTAGQEMRAKAAAVQPLRVASQPAKQNTFCLHPHANVRRRQQHKAAACLTATYTPSLIQDTKVNLPLAVPQNRTQSKRELLDEQTSQQAEGSSLGLRPLSLRPIAAKAGTVHCKTDKQNCAQARALRRNLGETRTADSQPSKRPQPYTLVMSKTGAGEPHSHKAREQRIDRECAAAVQVEHEAPPKETSRTSPPARCCSSSFRFGYIHKHEKSSCTNCNLP
jgi:hypothetical protein